MIRFLLSIVLLSFYTLNQKDAYLIQDQQFNMQNFVQGFQTPTALEWQEMTPGIYYLYSGIMRQWIWKMLNTIFQDRPFILSEFVYFFPGILDV